nr:MAG TPA: hypothetical protein [Caudoviricetes sp.]
MFEYARRIWCLVPVVVFERIRFYSVASVLIRHSRDYERNHNHAS